MGSKLTCENDYVEILEENDSKEFEVTKRYCGDDKPAVFIGLGSKIKVHYKQSVHFAGTGWMINFMGIHEGKKIWILLKLIFMFHNLHFYRGNSD